VFGPGHNGFFRSPDGTEDWIVYHAKTNAFYTYRGRETRAQKFTWNPDGTPNFGEPVPLSAVLDEPSSHRESAIVGKSISFSSMSGKSHQFRRQ
jgi:hypothetical protein